MYTEVIKIFSVGFPYLTWLLPVVILLAKEPVEEGGMGIRMQRKVKLRMRDELFLPKRILYCSCTFKISWEAFKSPSARPHCKPIINIPGEMGQSQSIHIFQSSPSNSNGPPRLRVTVEVQWCWFFPKALVIFQW